MPERPMPPCLRCSGPTRETKWQFTYADRCRWTYIVCTVCGFEGRFRGTYRLPDPCTVPPVGARLARALNGRVGEGRR